MNHVSKQPSATNGEVACYQMSWKSLPAYIPELYFLPKAFRNLTVEIHISSSWAHFLGVDKLSSRWQSVNTLLMAFRVERNFLKFGWETIPGRTCCIFMVFKHTSVILISFWGIHFKIKYLSLCIMFALCLLTLYAFVMPSSSKYLYYTLLIIFSIELSRSRYRLKVDFWIFQLVVLPSLIHTDTVLI